MMLIPLILADILRRGPCLCRLLEYGQYISSAYARLYSGCGPLISVLYTCFYLLLCTFSPLTFKIRIMILPLLVLLFFSHLVSSSSAVLLLSLTRNTVAKKKVQE